MATTTTTHTRPPFWRDAVVMKWLAQVAVLALVLATLFFFANQAGDNLALRDIDTSFDFIDISPGFDISEGIDTKPDTGGRALWVGMVNTFRVAGAGLVMATLLGVLVGVARLSHNWLVQKVASVYVETFRNIPLLVQILFWFAVVTGGLSPLTEETGPIPGWLIISQKGASIPRVFAADGFYQWLVFLVIGAAVGRYVHYRLATKRDTEGGDTRPNLMAFGVLLAFAVVGWFAHPVFSWLGSVFNGIASGIDSIPVPLIQALLAAFIITATVLWIRRFLASFVTPAGRAKMTDDDIFRVVFAGVIGLIGTLVIVRWTGLSSWIHNSGRDFFEFLAAKFSSDRTGQPIDAMKPQVVVPGRFPQLGPSGLTATQWFLPVFIGVVIYTAAFIAEIVRGGILAVAKGQTEAASALGLKRSQLLRLVVLPQAFRIILPPLGNQYLNLVKNTSLAIAVGYADLVNVGTTLQNQSGKAIQVIAIWMLFYLACSLTISVIVNYFNNRMRIVER